MFLILLINALMGATFSIVKLILDHYTDPVFLVGYRMMLAGFLLLSYLYIFKRSYLKVYQQDWLAIFKVAIFHVYICYICEFWSQKYLAPAKVALLFNLTPFITAGLSYLLYQHKQNTKKMVGLIIGFLGFLPILLTHDASEAVLGSFFLISIPELVLLMAVASGAYGWLIVQHLVIKRKYSIIMINGYGMLAGGMLAMLTSLLLGNYGASIGLGGLARAWSPWPFNNFGVLTLWVLLLIVFSNLIYYNVYGWLMHKYSPTLLSFSGLTIPLFAAFWEWLFLGIIISWPFWMSLAIITFGLTLYYREEMAK